MADKAKKEQETTVRMNIEQIVEKAVPLFEGADAVQVQVQKQDAVWLNFAREFVAPHIGAFYADKKVEKEFRTRLYERYCDTRGTWTPRDLDPDTKKPISRGKDFLRYASLVPGSKDQHPTADSIKHAMNNAKVYFDRIRAYTKQILESGDTGARSGPRSISERMVETLEKLISQSDKLLETVQLGQNAATYLKSLRDAANWLKTNGFAK